MNTEIIDLTIPAEDVQKLLKYIGGLPTDYGFDLKLYFINLIKLEVEKAEKASGKSLQKDLESTQ